MIFLLLIKLPKSKTINMVSQYMWIGLAVGLFFAGLGAGYAIFTNTYNPYSMMGNPAMFSQMMEKIHSFLVSTWDT